MKMTIFIKLTILALLYISVRCRKDDEPPEEEINTQETLLILNEGLFQQNNASLTHFSLKSEQNTQQFFLETNDRGLGDTGNDMIRYGNKIYVLVNVSGQVEVINLNDYTSIAQISLIDNGQSRQPRSAEAFGGKVWITNFDGTVAVIDTSSLVIENYINVGKNPEGIVYNGGYLYIANSGGLDFPDYDTTVSVIDPATQQVIATQTIGINPGAVAPLNNGSVLVLSRGNYNDIDPQLYEVNTSGSTPVLTNESVQGLYYSGGKIMIRKEDDGTSSIWELDHSSLSLTDQVPVNPNDYTTFYGVEWIPSLQTFVVKDANNYNASGSVNLINQQGQTTRTITAGLLPTQTLYIP